MSPGRNEGVELEMQYGRTWTLNGLRPSDNVGMLWQAAEAKAGVSCPPLVLKCGTRYLVDPSCTLAFYGVTAGATLEVMGRIRGGMLQGGGSEVLAR